jgi:hypothetical protein
MLIAVGQEGDGCCAAMAVQSINARVSKQKREANSFVERQLVFLPHQSYEGGALEFVQMRKADEAKRI